MPNATVDDYIAGYPAQTQSRLRELRSIFLELLPDATEQIAYGVPTYKLSTGTVAHFGATRSHCALYGLVSDAEAGDLDGYSTSKGTVRFPLDQRVPAGLVRKLVSSRLAVHQAAQRDTSERRPNRARPEAATTIQ